MKLIDFKSEVDAQALVGVGAYFEDGSAIVAPDASALTSLLRKLTDAEIMMIPGYLNLALVPIEPEPKQAVQQLQLALEQPATSATFEEDDVL